MPRPAIDFDKYLLEIPRHATDLPAEALVPIRHHGMSSNQAYNLLLYVQRNLKAANVYRAPKEEHLRSLRVMVLLSLIEAFERLLKELAAACIDRIARFVPDTRLDEFTAKGSAFAWHFDATGSLGSVLCEPLTWCDCKDANDRFRKILASPYDAGNFYVFPQKKQQPSALAGRFDKISILWQLRHAIVHNRGILTASDACKLRLLCKREVQGSKRLSPSDGDVWYVKLFLDETAEFINREVGARVAALLSELHATDNSLFAPAEKAQEIAELFQQTVTVAGHTTKPL